MDHLNGHHLLILGVLKIDSPASYYYYPCNPLILYESWYIGYSGKAKLNASRFYSHFFES